MFHHSSCVGTRAVEFEQGQTGRFAGKTGGIGFQCGQRRSAVAAKELGSRLEHQPALVRPIALEDTLGESRRLIGLSATEREQASNHQRVRIGGLEDKQPLGRVAGFFCVSQQNSEPGYRLQSFEVRRIKRTRFRIGSESILIGFCRNLDPALFNVELG